MTTQVRLSELEAKGWAFAERRNGLEWEVTAKGPGRFLLVCQVKRECAWDTMLSEIDGNRWNNEPTEVK